MLYVDMEPQINSVNESLNASTMAKSGPEIFQNRMMSFLRQHRDYSPDPSLSEIEEVKETKKSKKRQTSDIDSEESETSFNQYIYKNFHNPSSVSDTLPSDQTVTIGNNGDLAKLKENEKVKKLF